ncbi:MULTISPECIES: hypothetical protein [unclassified Sphingomonas]|uniref:hypothetical protein n=1 Tax=unclassified Sphingomonas TaxID=196159 RepID=UPI00226B1272|nr:MULTISPECIES: hypothetical protein [unclassified Sphingomonas]
MTIASSEPEWNRRTLMSMLGSSAILSEAGVASFPTKPAGTPAIVSAGRSIEMFGARPDASGAINLQALRHCIAACREDGSPIYIPAGTFTLANDGQPIILDLTRRIRGAPHAVALVGLAGAGQSLLQIDGSTGGIHFEGPTDWFDPVIEGVSVVGALAGPLVSIGRSDFSDPVNMLRLRDVSLENSFNRGSVTALRLNYLAPGSVAIGLKANAYSDGRGQNYGTAIECRQVECMTFVGGAASNADIGFAIRDGVNFGVSVQGFTFENTNVAFSNEIATSGSHIISNSQFSEVRGKAIQSTGCNRSQWIDFIANNYAILDTAIVNPEACEGVRIHDRHGVVTPLLPASGTTTRNLTGRQIQVMMWGGVVSSLVVDHVRMQTSNSGALPLGTTVMLDPGSTIVVDYTHSPSWAWL